MTALELRNVRYLAEHSTTSPEDRRWLELIVRSHEHRPLTDETIAEISRIRACAGQRQ